MTPPETRYARSGDARIAYQVVGEGPLDLVYVPGFISNLDLLWESPAYSYFFTRLAAFSRLILFDKRGTGLSDRMAGIANLEERMDARSRKKAQREIQVLLLRGTRRHARCRRRQSSRLRPTRPIPSSGLRWRPPSGGRRCRYEPFP